jgi:hypothetical protein
VIRRAALEAVGGVLTDTVAEDFHTTIAMHARGWRTRYHNETLVQGLAPHDLAGFLLQRARWARGNLRVFRTSENPLTCHGLAPRQRASYFASLFGYFSGLQRLALLSVLVWTLATARLPMHASVLPLGVLWLPWVLLGVAVFRALRLLTVVAVALAIASCLRVGAALGVLDGVGTMPDLALGVWELACITIVLGSLVRRRQLRRTYRVPVGLQARIANSSTVVPLRDLTPEGVSFESAVALEPGTRLVLLTRLLTAAGERHDVALPVEVRRVRPFEGGHQVGVRFQELDDATHDLLVEYCYVVASAQRHGRYADPVPADSRAAGAQLVAAG